MRKATRSADLAWGRAALRSFHIGLMKHVIHNDAYLELRRLAGAEGALKLKAYRRRRVVVGRERAKFGGAAGVEVGSRILRVGVSVPLHPHVDVTWGGAALS